MAGEEAAAGAPGLLMLGRAVCCRPAAGLAAWPAHSAAVMALPGAPLPTLPPSASVSLLLLRSDPARLLLAGTRDCLLLLDTGDVLPCLSSRELEGVALCLVEAAPGSPCLADLAGVRLDFLTFWPVAGDSEKSSTNPPLGTYRFSEVDAS